MKKIIKLLTLTLFITSSSVQAMHKQIVKKQLKKEVAKEKKQPEIVFANTSDFTVDLIGKKDTISIGLNKSVTIPLWPRDLVVRIGNISVFLGSFKASGRYCLLSPDKKLGDVDTSDFLPLRIVRKKDGNWQEVVCVTGSSKEFKVNYKKTYWLFSSRKHEKYAQILKK